MNSIKSPQPCFDSLRITTNFLAGARSSKNKTKPELQTMFFTLLNSDFRSAALAYSVAELLSTTTWTPGARPCYIPWLSAQL